MSTLPDLATRRAHEILRELNIDPTDTDTLRRVRGFILVNGYEGVHAAAEITKNISLSRVRQGRSPLTNRWNYCRTVYNRATGYASWAFTLLNLIETSLRAWVDSTLAQRLGI